MKTNFRSIALLALAAAFGAAATAYAAGNDNKGQIAAYVWADQPANASYSPNGTYQFNITKGANSITRTAAGAYTVKLAGVKTSGGHAQVTSYGAANDHCKIVSWNPAGADETVKVACFNGAGAAADAQFSLIFFN